MRISAIVCAYNEADFLPACLHSLLSQTRPPDEIIVINNASSDEMAAIALDGVEACWLEGADKVGLRAGLVAPVDRRAFPGGPLLRYPAQILGMLWYALRDRI